MSRDLFLAILSMDSYNRGYGPGIKLRPDSGMLGSATILDYGDSADWDYGDSADCHRILLTDALLGDNFDVRRAA